MHSDGPVHWSEHRKLVGPSTQSALAQSLPVVHASPKRRVPRAPIVHRQPVISLHSHRSSAGQSTLNEHAASELPSRIEPTSIDESCVVLSAETEPSFIDASPLSAGAGGGEHAH